MFAWLDSASIDCARLIRGTASIAKLVAPRLGDRRNRLAVGQAAAGTRSAPPSARRRSVSSAFGGATLTHHVAARRRRRLVDHAAPASSYCSSGISAPAPAPRSHDRRLKPWLYAACRRPPGPAPRGARPRPSPSGLRSACGAAQRLPVPRAKAALAWHRWPPDAARARATRRVQARQRAAIAPTAPRARSLGGA